uniref:Uncharacterized LOC111191182 n=1 Tax=Astyanax mexicanus TaxID=7994 RepID=A0A3B1ITB5_ASTMX
MDPHRSVLKSKLLNIIPAGRQLQRTPPSTPRREPTPGGDTHTVIKEETHTPAERQAEDSAPSRLELVLSPAVKNGEKSIRRASTTPASANTGDADPNTFIQGMQGYQWTDADLEFIHQVKQQKQAQQLQLSDNPLLTCSPPSPVMDPQSSVLKSKLLNIIPAGRQLQRTPPSTQRREQTPGGDTRTL